jgi:hypothetical protein
MLTVSVEAQLPLAIVQRSEYAPAIVAVAVEVAECKLLNVMVPGPLRSVQVPVPTDAELPARVATSPQTL